MFVQIDARGVLNVVFRQFWKFVIVATSIVLFGIIYLLFATPVYQSTAKILIKFGQDARPEMVVSENRSGLSAEEKRGLVQSNVNIIASRDLAELLFADLGVETVYPELQKKIDGDVKRQHVAIKLFMDNLETMTESNAGLIQIAYHHDDPSVARTVLEKFLALYIERQSEIYGNPQAKALREQAEVSYQKLVQANQNMLNFKEKVGVSSIDEEISLSIQKRAEIESYLSQYTPQDDVGNENEKQEVAAQDGDIEDAVINKDKESSRIIPTKKGGDNNRSPFPALDEIQARIDELRIKENELLQTYRPSSDMMVNLRKNIETENKALQESVDALADKLSDFDQKIAFLSQHKAEYDVLSRRVEFAEETYRRAEARLQAAEVNDDLNNRKITQVSVIESPVLAEKPVSPKKFLVLLLCIIVGGVFGSSAIVLAELIDLRFCTPEQLAAHIKFPVLSSFSFNVLDSQGKLEKLSFKERSLQMFRGKTVMSAHTGLMLDKGNVANLYQSLVSSFHGKPVSGVLCIASSYRKEGASTIGWELSNFVADTADKKVLFIDTVGAFVPSLQKTALRDVAVGDSSIDDAISVVDSKEYGEVSAVQFFNERDRHHVLAEIQSISEVMDGLKKRFDLIIMPVSNVVSDAVSVAMASLSDGVVFVVEADRTRAPVVKKSIRLLKDAGAMILGTVLNKRMLYIPKWLYLYI